MTTKIVKYVSGTGMLHTGAEKFNAGMTANGVEEQIKDITRVLRSQRKPVLANIN